MEDSSFGKLSAVCVREPENSNAVMQSEVANEQKRSRRRRGRRSGRGGKLKQNSGRGEAEKKHDEDNSTKGTANKGTVKREAMNALGKPSRGDSGDSLHRQQQPTNLSSLSDWAEAPENDPAVVKGNPVVYERCDICGNTGGQLEGDRLNTAGGGTFEEEQKGEEKKEIEDSSTNTLEEEGACPECSSVDCAEARREGRQILASMFRKELKDITTPPCIERRLDYLGDWKEAFLELQRLFPDLGVSVEREPQTDTIYTLHVLYCGEPPENPPAVVKGKPVVYEEGYLADS